MLRMASAVSIALGLAESDALVIGLARPFAQQVPCGFSLLCERFALAIDSFANRSQLNGATKTGRMRGIMTNSILRRPAITAAALLAGSALATPALAQDDDGLYIAQQRANRITVIGSRLPTEADELPVTVTVIDAVQIADELVTDIKDLVRFEPGVTVQRQPARFGAALGTTGRAGNSGFTIRGIGGNRTLILVDGVRVPDGFSFGAQDAGRGDYVDLGLVKRVEILRGPASALYGSDGLAGVVAFTLSDPEDFLEDGKSFGGLVRASYSSADNEFAETAILAGDLGDISLMAVYTRRDFEELETAGTNDVTGSTRTVANPQDGHSDAFLGRIVFEPAGGHELRLTGEYTETYLFTDVLSGLSGSVLDLKGTDSGERIRLAADWSWTPADSGGIEYAHIGAYWQDAEDRQFTAEDRNPAADRTRINTFENRVYGASAEARAAFATGGLAHRVVFGGDVSWLNQKGLRDGTVPPAGETFPTRAFPETDFMLAGVFIGDEIELADGLITLFPALRFDTYKLDAQDDPLLPAFDGADQSDSRLSPKFGAVLAFDDFRLFGNYAAGFKAPTPSQVNNFFANPLQGYTSIPNPDLKPETSTAFEGGIRYAGDIFSASLTAFHSEYEDFIAQIETTGLPFPSPPDDLWEFQWVNLTGAEISGIEGRAELTLRNGITARGAFAYAKGDEILEDGSEAPLTSVDPLTLVGGIGYRDRNGRFGSELIATHHDRKSAETSEGLCGANPCFRPGSFTILDATAFVRLFGSLTLRAGVFNILDKKHTQWSDVRGVALVADPDNPGSFIPPASADAYTRPGRSFSASISYRF
jgi:hemoglobin/transferrin/lactoferrin receptor protein